VGTTALFNAAALDYVSAPVARTINCKISLVVIKYRVKTLKLRLGYCIPFFSKKKSIFESICWYKVNFAVLFREFCIYFSTSEAYKCTLEPL